MLLFREWYGEEGVGGGGPGVSLLAEAEEGSEGVLGLDVSSSSSSSEAEAASSQESTGGAFVVALDFLGDEMERFFRDESRPGKMLEYERLDLNGRKACLWPSEKWLSFLLFLR